ncbi:MAG: DNA-binding protein [Thermonema sp.]|nr:MAG: DNA-binding protein [Thermonema sp.]
MFNQTVRFVEEKRVNNGQKEELFSKRVRAGKRTYFIDVRATRGDDFYLTITESKKRFRNGNYVYEKHKIFLYKEDFAKFTEALQEAIDHIKNELMPDVDFSQFEKTSEELTESFLNDGLDSLDTEFSTEDSDLKWD